ncbi:MAG TPA: FAD-dependent oxidoreductase [Candidatus Eisenbacteria bacterium]|nr:FAD-dependent oxidoreductase [Candidatus Eisenbacteria bacterium]
MASEHVVVLGGGYAGQMAAARLAERCAGLGLTVVDASAEFVERIRLHQLAAGERMAVRPMRKMLPRGATFVHGRVVTWEPDARRVIVGCAGGGRRSLEYTACVYALGSRSDVARLPGGAEHARVLDDPAAARAIASDVAVLAARGGRVLVVGGGATGIEAAAELAERHPRLEVALATSGAFGAPLSAEGVAHVRAALRRLRVTVREHARVVALEDGAALVEGGHRIAYDLCLWGGGFRAPDLARQAGLPVDGSGRVRVDATLRVPGRPEILVAGDAAVVRADDGSELRMACATAMPLGVHAAEEIARARCGASPHAFRFAYAIRCMSLGRRDGLVQHVDTGDRPRPRVWTGWRGALVKEIVCRSTVLSIRTESRLRIPVYRWPVPPHGARPLPMPATVEE